MADALVDRLDRTIDLLLDGHDATAALADEELSPLAVVASDLRFCPSPAFKARLRATLERRTKMTMILENVKLREGFTTVTPYIRVRTPGLVQFLAAAFGAVETSVTTTTAGGGVHREVRVGDSMLMVGEGGPEGGLAFAPASFHVFVPDVDAAFARAIAAGGKSLGAPENRPYGERSGYVEDPLGNRWYIATSLGPTPVPAGHRTVTPYIHPRGVPSYIDFLKRALSAVEEFRAEHEGVVMHARVRIGDGAIEMGEGQSQSAPEQVAFYLYVADCDALYEQAVAAGATPLFPPAPQSYGDRMGAVRDQAGTTWFIARPA
jgi:PhnB protein